MSILFKFASSKEFGKDNKIFNFLENIQFDTPTIPLGKLKQSIISQKKLGKATDFDLIVKNAQTNQEYHGDNTMIPKNTSVLIERVPIVSSGGGMKIPGLGTSSTSLLPTLKVVQKQEEKEIIKPKVVEVNENEKIKNLLQQSQEWVSDPIPDYRYSSRLPPPNYICHRCNVPGHYIQFCKTNGDPNFDIVKLRKPVGIPRSFLKQAENENEKGALLLPGGGLAIVVPNESEFEKLVSKGTKINPDIIPSGFQCPLCKQLFNQAVLINCCGTSFCDTCITKTLVEETKFTCPECKTNVKSLDSLVPNKKLRESVENFKKSASEVVKKDKEEVISIQNKNVNSEPVSIKQLNEKETEKPKIESPPQQNEEKKRKSTRSPSPKKKRKSSRERTDRRRSPYSSSYDRRRDYDRYDDRYDRDYDRDYDRSYDRDYDDRYYYDDRKKDRRRDERDERRRDDRDEKRKDEKDEKK